MREITALGGTLVRRPDGWCWSDGRPAHGCRDLTINSYNFRISGGMVEVPVRAAQRNEDLRWCLSYPRHLTRRGLILVPVANWDEQAKTPIGVEWPKEIELAILDRAMELGWEWPGVVATGMDASRAHLVPATAAEGSDVGIGRREACK